MIWQSDATGENAFRQQFAQKKFTWACRGAPRRHGHSSGLAQAPACFSLPGGSHSITVAPTPPSPPSPLTLTLRLLGPSLSSIAFHKIQKFSFSFSWTICCFIAELYAEVFSMTLISRLPSPTPRTEPAPPHFLLALGKVLPTRSHTLPPHTLPSPHSPLLRRCPPCYAHGT